MIKTEAKSVTAAAASRRFLPLFLLLFAGSGCSALIYEIVWYQLLQLVIGSSAISLGVLLATFMGGLCLGSLAAAAPEVVAADSTRCACTRKIEFGHCALCGILVLFLMPLVDGVYTAAVGHGMPAILLRALVSGALPAAADLPDGRVAAGRVALDRSLAGRRRPGWACSTARNTVRRGVRLPARRLLPAARVRYGHGHVRGGGDQYRGRPGELLASPDALRNVQALADDAKPADCVGVLAGVRHHRALGRDARSARKSSGRACSA